MVKYKKESKKEGKKVDTSKLNNPKRERLLLKMLEEKKKLAKAKELVFTGNPININWKFRLFKRANFKMMDIINLVFVRALDFVNISRGFSIVSFASVFYGVQSVNKFKKGFNKKFSGVLLSLCFWIIALNLRKQPNFGMCVGIKGVLEFLEQYGKASQFVKLLLGKGNNKLSLVHTGNNIYFKNMFLKHIVVGFRKRKMFFSNMFINMLFLIN